MFPDGLPDLGLTSGALLCGNATYCLLVWIFHKYMNNLSLFSWVLLLTSP